MKNIKKSKIITIEKQPLKMTKEIIKVNKNYENVKEIYK